MLKRGVTGIKVTMRVTVIMKMSTGHVDDLLELLGSLIMVIPIKLIKVNLMMQVITTTVKMAMEAPCMTLKIRISIKSSAEISTN